MRAANLAGRVALVAAAYYGGAWLGVTQTITPEGIAVLRPPNAVLLAAFLLVPYRHWPAVALAALAAECLADVPAFPLWAALAFGLVNLSETALAAALMRRFAGDPFDFHRMHDGASFLVFGPLLASSVAALGGASVYALLGRAATPFLELWQTWWFGDALGMMILTPLIVVLLRRLQAGAWPRLSWSDWGEAGVLVLSVIALGLLVFRTINSGPASIDFAPILLLPLGMWAAARFGVLGATATVALVAALAIGHLVRGMSPYPGVQPQAAVWLVQEYLAIVAVVTVGLALVMHEIWQQRAVMREQERALEEQNATLHRSIAERTEDLERVNRDLRAANARLEQLATTDFLTGFANRRHFEELGERELRRLRRDGATASLVVFDLDHFKAINDRFGHQFGDIVLQRIGDPVSHSMRPRDLCGRTGGEEFAVLLPAADQEQAQRIAERIRAGIAALRVEHRGEAIPVTASFGVVEWDGRAALTTLMHRADAALYRAKHSGRNRVCA